MQSKFVLLVVLLCAIGACFAMPNESKITEFSLASYLNVVPGDLPGNCTSDYSCAGKGDACTGAYGSGIAANCNLTSSNCCAAGLFCINSTCVTDNIGDSCTTVLNCHSDVQAMLGCIGGACQYVYGAGDTCTTSNDCAFGLNCSSSVCQGYTAGQACTSSFQCAFGLVCGIANATMQCIAAIPSGGSCSAAGSVCAPGFTCIGGKCATVFSVNAGGACSNEYTCATDLVCATNGTCVTATTSLMSCTNTTDCNAGSLCACSQFSGESFCIDPLFDPCTEQSSDLVSCLASSSCTSASAGPNSCAYNNCYSDIKKANSCTCSASDTVGSSCFYNTYCGGFPVWAIIVIIVVAIVLVLAIVLLVFFMMRRRRQYDSI